MNGKDKDGTFYKWGQSGHKYYYIAGNKKSRNIAKRKAIDQAIAIAINKRLR